MIDVIDWRILPVVAGCTDVGWIELYPKNFVGSRNVNILVIVLVLSVFPVLFLSDHLLVPQASLGVESRNAKCTRVTSQHVTCATMCLVLEFNIM